MSALVRPIVWNDAAAPEARIDWLWPGLLAAGNLTLLTGGWKCGKTTLISLLLERRHEGGILLNREVRPGATVIVSEEDPTLWSIRQRRLTFGPRVGFFCRPFAGRPNRERWLALLDEILGTRNNRGVDLVVIDPLAMFLPGNENVPTSVLAPLADLQRLTQAGFAVMLLHHPRKGQTRVGEAARGTGALTACADILLELRVPPGDPGTRRRRLFGFARYPETPRRLTVELNEAMTDYAVIADSEEDEAYLSMYQVMAQVLLAAPRPLSRQEMLASWPPDHPAPDPLTLWRWLTRATSLGHIEQTGSGKKGDPYRYRAWEGTGEGAAREAAESDY